MLARSLPTSLSIKAFLYSEEVVYIIYFVIVNMLRSVDDAFD